MKVVFFNITWMKRYQGEAHDDQLRNDNDSYEHRSPREIFNFKEFQGCCYGNVYIKERLSLEKYFEDISENDEWSEGFTVIWCAMSADNKMRIIGWYKNADVYQVERYITAYCNNFFTRKFNTHALVNDCYLIPAEQRHFIIDENYDQAGEMGFENGNVWFMESDYDRNVFLPKVLVYLENYNGDFVPIVFKKDRLNTALAGFYKEVDYYALLNKGIRLFNDQYYDESLKYFNTARSVQETAEILFMIGTVYLYLDEYKEAAQLFEECLDQDYEPESTLIKLIACNDYCFNRLKTLEYCYMLMRFYEETKNQNQIKIRYNYSCIMCDILAELGDYQEALKIANDVLNDNEENRKQMLEFIDEMEKLSKHQSIESLNLISISNIVKLNSIIKETELTKKIEIEMPNLQGKLKTDSLTKAQPNLELENYFPDMNKRMLLFGGRCKTLEQQDKSYEVTLSFDSWENYAPEYSSFIVLSTKPVSFGSIYFCQLKLSQALEDQNNIYIVKNLSKLAGEGAIARLNKGANSQAEKRERRNELVKRLNKNVITYDNQLWICIDTISKTQINDKNYHHDIFNNLLENVLNYALTIEELVCNKK